MAWRADNKTSVEDSSASTYLFEKCLGPGTSRSPTRLYFVPSCIMTRRKRLTHSRRSVTQSDIAVAFARIAKLGEPPVFKSFH